MNILGIEILNTKDILYINLVDTDCKITFSEVHGKYCILVCGPEIVDGSGKDFFVFPSRGNSYDNVEKGLISVVESAIKARIIRIDHLPDKLVDLLNIKDILE